IPTSEIPNPFKSVLRRFLSHGFGLYIARISAYIKIIFWKYQLLQFHCNNMTKSQNTQKLRNLIELNDELENYFKNTIIPQLFVDANLTLRKFTPPAMKQFNFSPEDMGKPFAELTDNIRYSTI